ncbi:MAG: FISUMP domain-containing protein [Flavobacteriales bacterium]
MKRFITAAVILLFCGVSMLQAQGDPSKNYETCAYWELIEQIRAYEDTLAFEASLPDTLRGEYGLPVTDAGVVSKVYRIYRCAALLDSLAGLKDDLDFQRATAPVVVTDSISAITATGATFHAKVTSDGGESVTDQWFRYGQSASNLTDSIRVTGTTTPFTKDVTALASGQYWVAGFAKNAKGTSSGDTLSFWIPVAPTVDTDSTSLITATSVTLHGKVISDGNGAITAQWFRYGTSATNLTDSIRVTGTATPFTYALTGLDPATRYYFAAFAKNVAGTSTGDTLSFLTRCSVDSVLHQSYYYGVIQAETQCWFDENLKVTTFNNGDNIPAGHDATQWGALSTPGRANPGNDVANVATYGRLYNWFAVSDARGLCPTGWHVPSEAAFDSLVNYLGGFSVAGTKLKALPPAWNGTDDIGFNGLPGGARDSFGTYQLFGSRLSMWTSTEATSANSARASAYQDGTANIINIDKNSGFSIRCLED